MFGGAVATSRTVYENILRPPTWILPAIFNGRGQNVALSSEISLIRCAPGCRRRCERGPFSHHRVPDRSKAFAPLRSGTWRPCSPVFVSCSPRSCCRCRFWCSASVRRPLLRTAHEEFANTPVWRPTPETQFAQSSETAPPVTGADAGRRCAEGRRGVEQWSDHHARRSARSGLARPRPNCRAAAVGFGAGRDSHAGSPEPGKPGGRRTAAGRRCTGVRRRSGHVGADQGRHDRATCFRRTGCAGRRRNRSAASAEAVAVPEPANVPAPATAFSTKIATLGGPPVTIAAPPSKVADAQADKSAAKKRHGRHAQRRKIALRTQQAAQQPANPFAPGIAIIRRRAKTPLRQVRWQPPGRRRVPIPPMNRHRARCRARRDDRAQA